MSKAFRIAAIAGDVLLAKDVDQLLDHVLRKPGVLGVGQLALPDLGGDREQIVLDAFDLHVFGELGDGALHFALAGDLPAQVRPANDLFEVHRARERLLDPLDFILAAVGDLELVGQHIVELDVNARLGFIRVRDERHGDPAQQADAPRHAQDQPAPGPGGVRGGAQFLEKLVHAGATFRTCFRE